MRLERLWKILQFTKNSLSDAKNMTQTATKYIFVTGGVVSSLGKGLTSAAIGALLEQRGERQSNRHHGSSQSTRNVARDLLRSDWETTLMFAFARNMRKRACFERLRRPKRTNLPFSMQSMTKTSYEGGCWRFKRDGKKHQGPHGAKLWNQKRALAGKRQRCRGEAVP